MNGNEISPADIRVTKLVKVRHFRTGQAAAAQLTMTLVGQAGFLIVFKSCFPQYAFVNEHRAVRPIVIVNRGALARLPAKHEHLDKLILHHPMPRVVAGLEAEERGDFIRRKIGSFD